MSEVISGSLGEGSHFDQTHMYFAHGVTPSTATLPAGWEDRLVPIRNENTRGATGWCLEVHDIATAKYFANRDKDRRYNLALWKHRLINPKTVEERLGATDITEERRHLIRAAVRADRAAVRSANRGEATAMKASRLDRERHEHTARSLDTHKKETTAQGRGTGC